MVKFFSHLLEKELKAYTSNPYVLPLAVGGYGTIEQYLLVKEISQRIKPDLVIHHWSANDIANNSYEIERYTPVANNNRYKPYYENGQIVYKSPYFFKLSPRIDSLMLMKVINNYSRKLFLKKINHNDMLEMRKDALNTTDLFLRKISKLFENDISKIGVINDLKVTSMYKKNGFITLFSDVPQAFKGLPRDNHPNGDGHAYMIKSVMPTIKKQLELKRD